MSDLKVGDVVRLKSGGPVMTVAKMGDGYVICQWFDEKKMRRANFPPDALTTDTDGTTVTVMLDDGSDE